MPRPSEFAWRRRRPGFLHVGDGAHVPVQLALRAPARAASACCGSRTPTRAARSRVATEQIQRSLTWLGLDWDGAVSFQLDRHGTLPARKRGGSSSPATRTRTRARSASACPTRATTGVRRPRARQRRDAERGARRRRARPLGRPPDLQLRVAGRGLAGRNHARHPRPRPHLEHAEADQHPARARRRAARLRAHARRRRRRREEALEAPRRAVARRVPRHGLLRAGADELPRAARLELRRQDDDHVARRADRAVLVRPRAAEPGDVRLQEARLDERRLPARAAARRVRGRADRATCGPSWDPEKVRKIAPLVQEKLVRLGEFPRWANFYFRTTSSRRTRRCSTRTCSRGRTRCCATLDDVGRRRRSRRRCAGSPTSSS